MSNVVLLQKDLNIGHHLQSFLQNNEGFKVVELTDSIDQARNWLNTQPITLVISDLTLARGHVCDLGLGASPISCPLMVLTVSTHEPAFTQALRCGAVGYFIHGSDPASLVDIARLVQQGESIITPDVARFIKAEFQREGWQDVLNELENDLIQRMSTGFLAFEVAPELGMSVERLRLQLRQIYLKLQRQWHAHQSMKSALV
jgi:DNA-binding NarL/FixJ family response regulator